jgi:hypothetical protein
VKLGDTSLETQPVQLNPVFDSMQNTATANLLAGNMITLRRFY